MAVIEQIPEVVVIAENEIQIIGIGIQGPPGPQSGVLSVFGRTGNVLGESGDYSASIVSFTPSGDISATTVQGAIEQVAAASATPGGANMSVQYNNSGSLGGFGTWDGTYFDVGSGKVFRGQYSNAAGTAYINPDGSAVFAGGAISLDNAGGVTLSTLTASELVATNASKKLQSLAVASYPSLAEIAYVKGVTSAIQTQLDNKVPNTRTINGHALSADVTLNSSDVGLGDVSNVAQLPFSYLDTDPTLAANSDSKVPSQKAVKTYADTLIAAANALVYKGVIDCSTNPNYPAADAGWLYLVSVAGLIGGALGVPVEAGDMIICLVDGSPSGNQATVGANWNVVQKNLDGVMFAAASSTDGFFPLFDGSSGNRVKNSAYSPASFVSSTLAAAMIIVGSNIGVAAAVAMSGDIAISNTGVTTIQNLAVTNAKVATGIDAVKIGAGIVNNTEFGYVAGASSNLQTQITARVVANGAIAGATKTKITYDAKGLITGGADATTADIADSTNRRYVTDAQLTVIGNTSGTNTGDQTDITGNAGTVTTINGRITQGTNVTITGSGTAASPYNISASGGGGGGAAWGSITGTLSDQTDLQDALDAKLSLVYSSGTPVTSIDPSVAGELYLLTRSAPGVECSFDFSPNGFVVNGSQITLGVAGAVSAKNYTGSDFTTSSLISTDASKKLVSLSTATYPSLTELSYGKGVTSAIQTQFSGKQPLDQALTSIAAQTNAVNKFLYTTGTDTFANGDFIPSASNSSFTPENIDWSGTTPPSGTVAAEYAYTQIGNVVFLQMNITYTVAGNAVTQMLFDLPSGIPGPRVMTGQGNAASELVTAGPGGMAIGPTNDTGNMGKTKILRNASNNGWKVAIGSAANSCRLLLANITYMV